MRLLRTMPTGRLLALIAAIVVVIAGGSAIAVAATGSGPVPPPKPLARAVHDALAAPAVTGISARVSFTNHLIDSSAIQGADPLLSGGSGRLWLAPGHGLRLELQSENGDAQLVAHGNRFWAYDPSANTVYEGSLPVGGGERGGHAQEAIPTLAQIQSAIARLAGHVSVSRAIPTDVAGRPAYTVRLTPRAGSGLLGGVALAFDADRGIPLRLDVYARGDRSPVLELSATDISYGPVAASVFTLRPPTGAKVVHVSLPELLGASGADRPHGAHRAITGYSAVAARVSFSLDAPAKLAGRTRSSVTLLGRGSDAGALIGYGQGLGGIYVIERPGRTSQLASPPADGEQPGLNLPAVRIGGSPAQELPTALGTVLQFARGGVSYTVTGSVTRATAERAARGL